MSINDIHMAAEDIRSGIERSDKATLPITFSTFPSGSCGDAALILGTHLKLLGLGTFNYVSGVRGSHDDGTHHSHAWLEGNGLIIDITADQFPEFPHRVFVSLQSAFHQSFESEVLHEADFRVYDQHTAAALSRAYQMISRRGDGN